MSALPLHPAADVDVPDDVRDPSSGERWPEREWDRPPVLPALGLILLGVVWLVFLVWPRPPADGSVDAGFLRDMITHHNQAVLMARVTHDGTADPAVELLAGDIADSQQVQVGEMYGYLEQWGLPSTNTGPAMAWMGDPVEGPMPGMATADEIANLRTLTGGALDAEFLRLMTRHHIAGTDMAAVCAARCDDAQVVRLARNITTTQQGEIVIMNEMLVARGQPAVSVEAAMAGMNMSTVAPADAGAPTSGETLRAVLVGAIRALPVVFGLIALGWLVGDALIRRRPWLDVDDVDEVPLTAVVVGVGAAVASAALHAGLLPGYLDARTGLGLFHGGVVVVQAAVVAALLVTRRRGAALGGAAVGLGVIAAWAVLKLLVPAGDEGDRLDLAVTVATAAEAVQAAALLWAWRQAEPTIDGDVVAAGT